MRILVIRSCNKIISPGEEQDYFITKNLGNTSWKCSFQMRLHKDLNMQVRLMNINQLCNFSGISIENTKICRQSSLLCTGTYIIWLFLGRLNCMSIRGCQFDEFVFQTGLNFWNLKSQVYLLSIITYFYKFAHQISKKLRLVWKKRLDSRLHGAPVSMD